MRAKRLIAEARATLQTHYGASDGVTLTENDKKALHMFVGMEFLNFERDEKEIPDYKERLIQCRNEIAAMTEINEDTRSCLIDNLDMMIERAG